MEEAQPYLIQYYQLLTRQQFDEEALDYGVLQQHVPFLTQLAKVKNTAITVFDLCKREHVFVSRNMEELFGYDMDKIDTLGNEYFDSRVHPEDFIGMLKNGCRVLEFFFDMPATTQSNYKFLNEYRVLDRYDKYIRVIEQHQVLELDVKGNVWLILCVMDISPNQDTEMGITSQIIDFKNGVVLSPTAWDNRSDPEVSLTPREKEVLTLIKKGLLSKEISGKLSISVHTVNTVRQRILRKLNADNSIEAVNYAQNLGLLN